MNRIIVANRSLAAEPGIQVTVAVYVAQRDHTASGKTGVLAFDLEGTQLWHANVGTGSAQNGWGSAVSPILHKNLVIVNANAETESIMALDKATGQEGLLLV